MNNCLSRGFGVYEVGTHETELEFFRRQLISSLYISHDKFDKPIYRVIHQIRCLIPSLLA